MVSNSRYHEVMPFDTLIERRISLGLGEASSSEHLHNIASHKLYYPRGEERAALIVQGIDSLNRMEKHL